MRAAERIRKIMSFIVVPGIIIVMIVSCIRAEDDPHFATAEENPSSTSKIRIDDLEEYVKERHGHRMNTFLFTEDEMVYRIFFQSDGFDFAELEVINLTKEKLEVELLELQIEDLKGY